MSNKVQTKYVMKAIVIGKRSFLIGIGFMHRGLLASFLLAKVV